VALSVAAVLRRYYAVSLVYALAGGFLVGVYPLFLRSRGLSQLEINSVLAVYFVVTFLTDVPTGAFADALGRRFSFVVGCALRCLGFALYFVSHAYVLFLVAEAIDAVGTTFCNGAVDAWGVDALDAAGFAKTRNHLFSRVTQLSTFGLMTTGVVGGYVGSIDIAWPWLLGAAGFAVSGFTGVLLRERAGGGARLVIADVPAAIVARIREGIQLGVAVRSVRMLSAAEGIILAVLAPFWVEWPLLFGERHGVGVWVVGWIFCMLSLAYMVGAEIVVRVIALSTGRAVGLGLFTAGAGVLLFIAGILAARPHQVLIVLVLMNVLLGAREPLARSWFNEQVTSEQRATMLSFRSAVATAGGSLGLLFGGYLVDLRGIPFHWTVAGTLALLAAPCYFSLRPGRR
jgi:MFS family permease